MNGKTDDNVVGINDELLGQVYDETVDFVLAQMRKHERLAPRKVACSAFGALSAVASGLGDDAQLYFLQYVVENNEARFAERAEAQNPMRHFRDDAA